MLLLLSWGLAPGARPVSPEYPITGFVLDHYRLWTAAALVVVGVILGYWLTIGPVAAAAGFVAFQLFAIGYELWLEPTSHNLLPIDIMGSVVIALPLSLGAWLGQTIQSRLRRSTP